MQLQLGVPPLQSSGNVQVETRPKHVKEWLDALPLANSQETARKLADALAALNGTKLAEDGRLKLLELYSETAQALLPALQQHYLGRALPLGEKQQQSVNLAREVFAQLANGYKRILVDLNQRRIAFGADKLAPVAIRRAIECLSQILDICYESYGPTPAGVWTEVHQLYWYAVSEQLQEKGTSEHQPRTVNAAYKQTLLTALVDPYRLLQGQMAQVRDFLAQHGHLAELQPMGAAENTHGLFLVRLNCDKPPKALAHHSGPTDARTDIILNTIPLARTVHQQLQAVEGDASLPQGAAQAPLLKRFLKQWGIAPKRMFSRVPREADVFICMGISSLHHTLSLEGLALDGSETVADGMITIQVGEPGADTATHQAYNCSRWQVLNEGAGGVALGKGEKEMARVKVGDILGFGAQDKKSIGIAVVRWAHTADNGRLEVGTQLLAPRAEPIAIKPVISAPDAIFQPALLLPQMPALQQPERIVAPRGSFQSMREFEVKVMGQSKRVRATQLLEQTDSFELFLFN